MSTSPDSWVYGDFAPDPSRRDLPGLKAKRLLEQLPTGATPLVLDYGVGEGKHLHLLRTVKPQARLVGVDVRAARCPVDFEFHQVRSNAPLPFESATFDLVISCDVLEHVQNIDQSLDEISRVLRSGGSFVGFVPLEGGCGPHGFFRLLSPNIYRDTKDHGQAYTRHQLLDKFSARFRIVKLSYSYHLFGATMDATFFASFKIPVLGPKLERFWRGQENDIYRSRAVGGTNRSLISHFVQLANRAAFYESVLLKNVALGARGLHFDLQKH